MPLETLIDAAELRATFDIAGQIKEVLAAEFLQAPAGSGIGAATMTLEGGWRKETAPDWRAN
jgi:hypothetical protein